MITDQNLALSLDDDFRKKLGKEIKENVEADDDSRGEWKKNHARWLTQFHQKDKPKAPPWSGSSEESVPVLAEACMQFASRASKALFPSRSKFAKASPVGGVNEQDRKRAERISRHLNYQVMVQDKTFRRKKRKLLNALPLHGSMFTKLRPNNGKPFIQNVKPTNLIVPYGVEDEEVESVDRKTHVQYFTPQRAEELFEAQFFSAMPKPADGLRQDDVKEAVDRVEGKQESSRPEDNIITIYEQHTRLKLGGDLPRLPYTIWIDAHGTVCRVAPAYFMSDEQVIPIEYFTQYDYFPNPDGLYGLGHGHLLGELQTSANKLLRMLIDSGELSTVGNMSGFINEAAGVHGGQINLELGEFKRARFAGPIDDAIWSPKFPGPHPALADALRLTMERGDRLGMITDALTGQVDKVMQPTAVLALIEQGLEPFTAAMQNVVEGCSRELQKLYRLNQSTVDSKEYFVIQGDDGTLSRGEITPADYDSDNLIQIYADPKQLTDQQKLAKSQALLEYGRSSPLVMQNPASLYAIERRYLEALEIEDIDGVLPAPHMVLPARVDDPAMENAFVLGPMPAVPAVHPDQNHMEHIAAHDALMQDGDFGGGLTPEAMLALSQHRAAHMSFLYMLSESLGDMSSASPVGPFGGQERIGSLAGAASDAGAAGGAAPRSPGIDGGSADSPRAGRTLSGAGAASVNTTRVNGSG